MHCSPESPGEVGYLCTPGINLNLPLHVPRITLSHHVSPVGLLRTAPHLAASCLKNPISESLLI